MDRLDALRMMIARDPKNRLARYGLEAAKLGALRDFLGGVQAGLQGARRVQRTPLSPAALRYLRQNYGRLWY